MNARANHPAEHWAFHDLREARGKMVALLLGPNLQPQEGVVMGVDDRGIVQLDARMANGQTLRMLIPVEFVSIIGIPGEIQVATPKIQL